MTRSREGNGPQGMGPFGSESELISLEALVEGAKAKWAAGQSKAAIAILEAAPAQFPGDDNVAATVGRTLASLGRHDAAQRCLEQWLEVNEGQWTRRELGLIYQEQKKFDEAEAAFVALCQKYPKSTAGFTARFDLLLELGDLDRLETELGSALKAFPRDRWIWDIAATSAERRDELARARSLWRTITAFAPSHQRASDALARLASLEPASEQSKKGSRSVAAVPSATTALRQPAKKAVVISNCQSLPLASWLTTLSAGTVFDFFGVHVLGLEDRRSAITNFIERARREYELVITAPLSTEFYDIASDNIGSTLPNCEIVSISNIYFSGLHPDLVYVGGLGSRVVGPMGDYHSRIAIYGFTKGLSIAQTQALFCKESYTDLRYFAELNLSMAELIRRDDGIDIPVSPILQSCISDIYCLYSVNHPTSELFVKYALEIIAHLEGRGLVRRSEVPALAAMCGESLAANYIYPIYPEIAAHHKMPQFGSYAFKPLGNRVTALSLTEFIEQEFDTFERLDRKTFVNSPTVKSIVDRLSILA